MKAPYSVVIREEKRTVIYIPQACSEEEAEALALEGYGHVSSESIVEREIIEIELIEGDRI